MTDWRALYLKLDRDTGMRGKNPRIMSVHMHPLTRALFIERCGGGLIFRDFVPTIKDKPIRLTSYDHPHGWGYARECQTCRIQPGKRVFLKRNVDTKRLLCCDDTGEYLADWNYI